MKKAIIGAIVSFKTIQNILPNGRQTPSMHDSIVGNETNKRALMCNAKVKTEQN